MEDRSQEILGKYELNIYNTYRTRGAYVLDTDQGLKLLSGYEGGEGRLCFEDTIKSQLKERGYENIDSYVHNSEDKILTVNSVGEKYIIKNWFDGEECNLKKNDKVLMAASNLSILHNCLTGITVPPEMKNVYLQDDLHKVFEKRIRELKRVKTYIRERKQKNQFEICYLSVCECFYRDALCAAQLLLKLPYYEMYEKAKQENTFCHGSYTYHNILVLNEGMSNSVCKAAQLSWEQNIATTNFEKAECGLQILDLYYFMRKTLEKNNWDASLGKSIIKEYETYRKLSCQEKRLLYVLMLFPEKFWKITNYYFNSKKSWIPQKNIQKLTTLSDQVLQKKKFLEKILQ